MHSAPFLLLARAALPSSAPQASLISAAFDVAKDCSVEILPSWSGDESETVPVAFTLLQTNWDIRPYAPSIPGAKRPRKDLLASSNEVASTKTKPQGLERKEAALGPHAIAPSERVLGQLPGPWKRSFSMLARSSDQLGRDDSEAFLAPSKEEHALPKAAVEPGSAETLALSESENTTAKGVSRSGAIVLVLVAVGAFVACLACALYLTYSSTADSKGAPPRLRRASESHLMRPDLPADVNSHSARGRRRSGAEAFISAATLQPRGTLAESVSGVTRSQNGSIIPGDDSVFGRESMGSGAPSLGRLEPVRMPRPLYPSFILPRSKAKFKIPAKSLMELHDSGGPIEVIGAFDYALLHVMAVPCPGGRRLEVSTTPEWHRPHAEIGPLPIGTPASVEAPASLQVTQVVGPDHEVYGVFQVVPNGYAVCRESQTMLSLCTGGQSFMDICSEGGQKLAVAELGTSNTRGIDSLAALGFVMDPGVDGVLVISCALAVILSNEALIAKVQNRL